MDRRSEERKRQLLADCEVSPAVFAGIEERVREFVAPFAARLGVTEQRSHANEYVTGLLSGVERKNVESIAYLHGQDRQPLQHFVGAAAWDHDPLVEELANQVGRTLGAADAVIVFDPSGFVKKGTASVGVQRQWIGRVGKVDNGQVGVYLGYVSQWEHTLVDVRLYLPKEWTHDRKRCKRVGVPKEVRFQTRHDLALAMLDRHGNRLPHAWVAGDDEMGRSTRFRRDLQGRGERYLLAVPSNTLIRDLNGPTPAYGGHGARPKPKWTQVDAWRAALPSRAWTRLKVRDGDKEPLTVEIAMTRVQGKTDARQVGPEEVLVVIRTKDERGVWKNDYYLSNAPAGTPLAEFARAANAEHRIEECIQRAKSEAGLADYEVRTWRGWYHHQTLSLLALWFLVEETRRGKKGDARDDVAASSNAADPPPCSAPRSRGSSADCRRLYDTVAA
jgi:SRSO17 transposase